MAAAGLWEKLLGVENKLLEPNLHAVKLVPHGIQKPFCLLQSLTSLAFQTEDDPLLP